MKKRIKESVSAKTFISMLVILMICCILIYGMVMIFLPKNYRSDLESQFVSEFQTLVQNGVVS